MFFSKESNNRQAAAMPFTWCDDLDFKMLNKFCNLNGPFFLALYLIIFVFFSRECKDGPDNFEIISFQWTEFII